ncbi:aminoglycoside phosphotransferase family protein [Lysinibacillus sphaericus]|uniref:aminoglycoside phosphotransferase family protein n=1 Tax=Lysinibacillus sphaericus TaxID=1421 RepID=UPI00068AD872|nr:aminoglycoside phosphotransferase family protein [Lysinibacillus sphaericus]
MRIVDIFQQLPSLDGFTQITEVHKGYSPDTKYLVTVGETRFFVRLANVAHREKRKNEFMLLQELEKQGVKTHKAIDYKVLQEVHLTATVVRFLEGIPADDVIQQFTDFEQFHLGLAAGQQLRKIHQVSAPPMLNWEATQRKKFSAYWKAYQQGSYHIPQEAK